MRRLSDRLLAGALAWFALLGISQHLLAQHGDPDRAAFTFDIVGDRTGSAVPGVYEEVWREVVPDHPAFVLTVGDTIEGGSDSTVDAEWQKALKLLEPYRRFTILFTPGNHDVWSPGSALAYRKYTGKPLHYSFDYQQVHITVLDNSRTDTLPAGEYEFLQKDLEEHKGQPVKFIVSHRPSWIYYVALGNPNFGLHQLARKYGVQYVVAGHVHEMLHYQLDGVQYISEASSGGHLRLDKAYGKGWFFQHTTARVTGDSVQFTVKEVQPPYGQSRVTALDDWGPTGLVNQAKTGQANTGTDAAK